jgi:hypothetical protein
MSARRNIQPPRSLYSANNIHSLSRPNLAEPTPPWWKSKLIVGSTIVFVLIVCGAWLKTLLTPSVIHYMADDNSDSAINNLHVSQKHCQVANGLYKEGDLKRQIGFAHQPEVVAQQEITNSFVGNGKCDEFPKTSKEVKQYPGTSLIRALEYIDTLIASDRAKGIKFPMVVTITIQAAENGPNLPKMDESGFVKIQKIVREIQKNNGVIAIIGTTGSLQQNLNDKIGRQGVNICPTNNMEKCVEQSFSMARNLGSIQ